MSSEWRILTVLMPLTLGLEMFFVHSLFILCSFSPVLLSLSGFLCTFSFFSLLFMFFWLPTAVSVPSVLGPALLLTAIFLYNCYFTQFYNYCKVVILRNNTLEVRELWSDQKCSMFCSAVVATFLQTSVPIMLQHTYLLFSSNLEHLD